jgi:hypothetical protein
MRDDIEYRDDEVGMESVEGDEGDVLEDKMEGLAF